MATINKVVPTPSSEVNTKDPAGQIRSLGSNFGAFFSNALERQNSTEKNESKPAGALTPPAGTTPSLSLPPVYIPMKFQLEENYHERALGLREYRQQLLASNIANADTPGYKARDFDVQEALRNGKTKDNVELKYSNDALNNVDGNTVDMDAERAKFMENAIMYEYEVDRVKGEFKDMQELLKNLPY